MSIDYQKKLFSSDGIEIFINFTGIDEDDYTSAEQLELTIYAINSNTYETIFSETLSFEKTVELYNHLDSISIIKNNTNDTSKKFIETSEDINEIISLIDSLDSSILKKILEKADEDEKLKIIEGALTYGEIENLHATIKQTTYDCELKNLEKLLELEEETNITESIKEHDDLSDYNAGQPEKIFQNWIEKNTWTLGVEYIGRHPARKIGITSESDLIMESTDGFIDLIELKRPKFDLFSYDNSHDSYFPSRDLSQVIGQCINYLKVLDDYKLILEKKHNFKLLKPRIKIIAGRSTNFDDNKLETLRMLNSNLNHIEIISYDYLHLCGKNIISYYSED